MEMRAGSVMKKVMKIIGLMSLSLIIVIGIYLSITPKTLDFRGTVVEITVLENKTTFYIEQPTGASYTVVADNKTKVELCHKDDPSINLNDIKVGNTIEGDYKWLTKNNEAKYITVWCEN